MQLKFKIQKKNNMSAVKSRLSFITPKPLKSDYPLFVFLPGMDGTGQLLHNQADTLDKSFDIRCLAIPPDDLNDWDSLANQAIDLIEGELRERPQRSVYLCGESFGGCLALKLALEAPWLFQRIILVNLASSFNQRPLLSWGVHITQWMPEFLHRSSTVGLLPFLAALGRIATSDRRALLNAMKSLPPKTVSWRLSLLADFALEERRLHRLTQPVLLIAGAADRLLPSVEEAERLVSRLPNAQMVVLPDSGHACLLETDVKLDEIMKAQNFWETEISKEGFRAVV